MKCQAGVKVAGRNINNFTYPWGHKESYTTEQLSLHSAYKLHKQDDNIQPWHTPFPIWNQSIVPCPVLTVASWPAYRFLRRQIRWSGIPISLRGRGTKRNLFKVIKHWVYPGTQSPNNGPAQPIPSLCSPLRYITMRGRTRWSLAMVLTQRALTWEAIDLGLSVKFIIYSLSHLLWKNHLSLWDGIF